MPARAMALGDPLCGLQFGPVTLAVVDREAVALESFALRPRKRGRRIEAAGKKDDCALQRFCPCASRCLALVAAGLSG